MCLISYYGSLVGFPRLICWSGINERMKKNITSLGMTWEKLWPSRIVGY
jgi:hypothetical protein